MAINDTHTSLYRVDASQNMSRFYTLSIQPNFFGGFSLMRNWGRIGTAGQLRNELFENEIEAQNSYTVLVDSKLKRGYRV